MEKIRECIERLCSEGVVTKKLSEISKVERGKRVVRKDLLETGIIPVYQNSLTPLGFADTSNYPAQTTFVISAGAAGEVGYSTTEYWGADDCLSIVCCNDIDSRFLFYFLKVKEAFLKSQVRGGAMKRLSKDTLEYLRIPLPPISIQQEIVRILDSFTQLQSNLEAELAARQKQYEYYRNKLLSFDKNVEDIERKTLGEVVSYSKERIHASFLNETNYVSVENLLQNKAGKTNSSCCPTDGNWIRYSVGDVLIGNIRPNLRKIWLADIDGGTNGDVLTIHIIDTYKEKLNPKYLYHILSSEDFFLYDIQNAKGAKMPRGDKDAVLRYPISIPSATRQCEIVATLDTFESLITNIKQELEARKKQYEYYREQLLIFE